MTPSPHGERCFLALKAESQALGRKLLVPEIKDVLQRTVDIILGEARLQWDEANKASNRVTDATNKPVIHRKRNEILDELVRLCGGDPEQTTKSEFRSAAAALADIKTACPGLTIEELRERVACYHKKNRDWTLTPMSLAKWWSHLSNGGPRTRSEQVNIYAEPRGWRAILQEMYQLSDAGIRDKQWLDLGPDTRASILQRMRNTA